MLGARSVQNIDIFKKPKIKELILSSNNWNNFLKEFFFDFRNDIYLKISIKNNNLSNKLSRLFIRLNF